jgi:hypothetical protein
MFIEKIKRELDFDLFVKYYFSYFWKKIIFNKENKYLNIFTNDILLKLIFKSSKINIQKLKQFFFS